MRFSRMKLRTFLIFFTVFVIVLGLYIRRSLDQKAAVSKVQQLGGSVEYQSDYWPIHRIPSRLLAILDPDFFFHVASLNLSKTAATDESLTVLEEFPKLTDLSLDNTRVTDLGVARISGLSRLVSLGLDGDKDVGDSGMEAISRLKELQYLSIWHTQVTDRGAEALSKLPKLTQLTAGGTKISDRGLAAFEGSTTMTGLVLQRCPITDRAMKSIATMPNISRLALTETQLSDVGIAELSGLAHLAEISLSNTSVTPTGLAELKAKLTARKVQGPVGGRSTQAAKH